MRIGLLGGSFDPVHNGHLALAKAAFEQLKLDRVYMVLSPLSPFKQDANLTPVEERLLLLEAALRNEKKIRVGEWELKRRGRSYTVKTLADYKKKRPSDELFLILGSDALAGFMRWKNPSKIMKMATLVIGRRPGTPVQIAGIEGRMFFLHGTFPEISSTAIRKQIGKGESTKDVPAEVAKLIKKLILYEK